MTREIDTLTEMATPTAEDYAEAAPWVDDDRLNHLDLDADAAKLRPRGIELDRRLRQVMRAFAAGRPSFTEAEMFAAVEESGVWDDFDREVKTAITIRILRAFKGPRGAERSR
jgi:hypothetical protein